MDRVFVARRASTAPRSSASRSTKRARRAPPTGSCGSRSASTTSRSSATASNPPTSSSTRSRSRSSTGDDDLRRDAMETIEAIRRIKAELPGRVDDPRAVERVASGSSPRPATCSTACSCTSAARPGSTPRSCTRRASCRCTRSTTAPREVALDLIYDRRRDDYDPLTEFMALFEGVEAGAIEQEDRSGWPVEERLKHRIIDGDRDGLEADLDEQLATLPALDDRQRRAARRHEGRRRAVRRAARCSCRSCCSRRRR